MQENDALVPSRRAREVLAYLYENPEAQDSLEGILSWWLLDRYIEEQTDEVESAMKELMESDLVFTSTAADGSTRYRLNPSRADRIAALLGRKPPPGES